MVVASISMMPEDPYFGWSLSDRLELLAFEAELARLPRGLIAALWQAIHAVQATYHRPSTKPEVG
jgi:hypothetical protein